jgi:lipoate-protein ligase A
MAIDEALFRSADAPVLRFYRWAGPELSIGYFVRWEGLPDKSLPITRRWTGGGIVEHGEDVVFSLIVPAKFAGSGQIPGFIGENGGARYRWIHERLAGALEEAGLEIALASSPPPDSVPGGRCFAAAVGYDLIDPSTGRKIAGGAQRAARGALLHQGSVRLPEPLRDPRSNWTRAFAGRMGGTVQVSDPWRPGADILSLAASLVESRYGNHSWLQRI